jgi:hypothetical protein
MMANCLYLAPEQVVLRAAGKLRQIPVAEPGWSAALAAAQAGLLAHQVQGSLHVVLSQKFAPLWLLPGAPVCLSHEETQGWVEGRLTERFGEMAANWQIAFQPAPRGAAILVSGMERTDWTALLQMLNLVGVKVMSVYPWPALALAHYAKQRGSVRLVLQETECFTLVSLRGGDVLAVDRAQIDSDTPAAWFASTQRAVLLDNLGEVPLLLVSTGTTIDIKNDIRVLANHIEQALLPTRGELDFLPIFHQRRPRLPRVAWLLLAAGLGLVGLAGERYMALQAVQATLQPETPVLVAKPKRKVSSVADVSEAMRNRSWPLLLNGLEGRYPVSGAHAVALLSLRADASKGEVLLKAEARSEAAMLAWLHELRSGFSEVSLLRHNIKADAEGEPQSLSFDIRLHWGAR